MTNHVRAVAALLPLCVLLLQATAAAEDQKITLTGSSTVAPLVSEIAQEFEEAHENVRVDVQTGGSSRGVADATNGLADIGMVSRALKPEDGALEGRTIALDGVCLIVHASNPVSELTNQQIVGIYTGKIRNWKEVGGRDAPITVVNKAEGRSTLELFASHFKLQPSQIRADVVIGDNQQGIKTVVGNPNAIGYVSIGTAEYEASTGAKLKLLPMNGVQPTTENVRNKSFPISRPLLLVYKGTPNAAVKSFLEYAASPAVANLVKEQYFVPPTN